MFKKLSLFLCIVTFIIGDWAYALSCTEPRPERLVANYDTIFVALISKAYLVEGNSPEDCDWVDGEFEIIEEIKGNHESVTVIRKMLFNCKNARIVDRGNFPVGKYILVATNNEVVMIDDCTYQWNDSETSCLVDRIHHQLNTGAGNAEVHERCIQNISRRIKLTRSEALRMELADFEKESNFLDRIMIKLKGEISEAELGEPPK